MLRGQMQGAVLGLAPLLRNPFCASTSSQRLSLGFPWDLVPPEDGAFFVRLKDADLRGMGPRGLLMDDALWSVSLGERFAGLGSGVGTHCLHLSVWIAFAWLLRPTRNNRLISSRLLLMKDHLGSFWGGGLSCLSVWQEKGQEGASPRPRSKHTHYFLL